MGTKMNENSLFERAADLLQNADSLIIGAGAGMGVDSGLPDFRGEHGFWNAYPALGRARMRFTDIARPQAFFDNPQLAWGFYGHRLNLYRATIPNPAFALLKEIAERLPFGAFVYTSNVDGQFQKAGFDPDRVWECHGSIHYLQCQEVCREEIWPAANFTPFVDEDNCLLLNTLPRCKRCHAIARPNILMFDDWLWVSQRNRIRKDQFKAWRSNTQRPVAIEIGAGMKIPSVRMFCAGTKVPLIRINPGDPDLYGSEGVSIALGGAAAMQGIAERLRDRNWLMNKAKWDTK